MDRAPLLVTSPTGVDVALPIAGAGSRSYAFLIDWHIRIVIALAWFLAATVITVGSPVAMRDASRGALWLIWVPATLIYLLYHPVLEVVMRGRTPGKRMAGVRLVTRSGGTPSLGALLIRNVFRLVDSLPFSYLLGLTMTLCTREQVRIGDLAAGTVLVHDAEETLSVLDALAAVSTETPHDPALIDIAQALQARWEQLEPERRGAIARDVLARLGMDTQAAADDRTLRDLLKQALRPDLAQ